MRQIRTHTALLGLSLLASATMGCNKQSTPAVHSPAILDPTLITPVASRRHRPTTNPSTLIHAGMLPIAYIFDTGGSIRIVDGNTKAILAKAIAPPGAIISIDPASGILVAQQHLLRGPLPANHRYEIWWDSRK